jgi:hypothetical protein
MSRPVLNLCPSCGKHWPAVTTDPAERPACPSCGARAQVWEKCASIATVPPPLPPHVSNTPAQPRSLPTRWVVASVVAIALGLGATLYYLNGERSKQREKDAIATANAVVSAKVTAAQAHIAHRDFDAALKVLDEALATENATRLDDARLALLQARQGQADRLLDDAGAAIAGRHIDEARRLLNDYLVHPNASQQPRARRLLEDLARATDEEAAARMVDLPDDKFTAFVEEGQRAVLATISDDGVRAIYKDTLQRHIVKEQEKRAARRAAEQAAAKRRDRAQAEREERVRATPAFQDLTAFLDGVRKQHREQAGRRQSEEKALELFFAQTAVTDAAEKQKAREALRAGRVEDVSLAVTRKKVQAKKDYRASKDHDEADEETFDRLVDMAVETLLRELREEKNR